MNDRAKGTMLRADKGIVAAAPVLDGILQEVSDAVASWSGVTATVHWDLYDRSQVDGVDFYVGDEELGHIHLDGFVHLATNLALGKTLVAEKLARPFPYQRGWVHEQIHDVGPSAAIELFRRNYARLLFVASIAPLEH